jgi:uncharacterized protein (DUF849 family)
MDDEIERLRREQFDKVMAYLAKRFVDKNRAKGDAFMTVVSGIDDAFSEVEATLKPIESMKKFSSASFDIEEYKKKLADLAIYTILNIMWIEEHKEIF